MVVSCLDRHDSSACYRRYFPYEVSLCDIMDKVLDYGLEFELYLQYYVHLWTNTHGKGMKLLFLPTMGLNSITAVLQQSWLWY